MEIFLVTLSFLFGIVVGSFLNVVIRRGIRGESLFGRSKCESCGIVLAPRELIPVISYILQGGKCRSCGRAFSIEYLIVELATGILFAAALFFFFPASSGGVTLGSFIYLILVYIGIASAIVIFVVDVKEQIIPEGPFHILFALGIIASITRSIPGGSIGTVLWAHMLQDVVTALAITLIFFALWFFSKGGWMGFGDVKLALATSLIVGFPAAIAAFLFSFWLGGIAGALFLLSRRMSFKSAIPFGPFILVGTVVAYFYSAQFFLASRLLDGIYEIIYYSF